MIIDPTNRAQKYILASATAFGAEQANGKEAHRHPLHPEIASPEDVTAYQKQMQSLTPMENTASGISAVDEKKRWWISGGRREDDPYVLNWSGPRNSDWDFVALMSRKEDGIHIFSSNVDSTWQWACRGSQYVTSITPHWIQYVFHSQSAFCGYLIWDASEHAYVALMPDS